MYTEKQQFSQSTSLDKCYNRKPKRIERIYMHQTELHFQEYSTEKKSVAYNYLNC